jgi:hypothetical protein
MPSSTIEDVRRGLIDVSVTEFNATAFKLHLFLPEVSCARNTCDIQKSPMRACAAVPVDRLAQRSDYSDAGKHAAKAACAHMPPGGFSDPIRSIIQKCEVCTVVVGQMRILL